MKQKLFTLILLIFLPFSGNGQIIKLTKDYAQVDTSFCRQDLSESQKKDETIAAQKKTIEIQENEIAFQDTMISLLNKSNSIITQKYNANADEFVTCRKDLKNSRRNERIWKYTAGVMTVVAFILGVK